MVAERRPDVVVVGAGFGGLKAVRALRNKPVNVILLDRHNYHLFQPLLYQVASAGLTESAIAHPIRSILRGQANLDVRMAEVEHVDFDARMLRTSTGDVKYDYLVLAIGGETNFYGIERIEKFGFTLKDLDDAVAIRNHLLSMFEQAMQIKDPEIRKSTLTFVVVGGGPTGVELSGALSELIRLVLVKDYTGLNIKDVRILLLEASDKLLNGFPNPLQEAAAETLWRKHVEVRFGSMVTDYNGEQVSLKSGELIPAKTLVWVAGVQGEHLVDTLGLPLGKMKRVLVAPTLQIPGRPETFIIGDAAFVEHAGHTMPGQSLPMMAPVAIQMGQAVAENIQRLIKGEPPQEFQYHDPGSLATIGRNAAVARLGRFQFSGFLAWLLWLVVHIIQIIGFRNRLIVLIDWAWDYLFYERSVRLITTYPTKPACDDSQMR